ncbi:MAG: glycogen/starch synthase [Chlamydiota bacterium]|nr:glycogen/starch synthase [Chlamydiota bacterium]
MQEVKHIVFASTEAKPYASDSGMGNFLEHMPKCLSELGHHVTLILPYYRQIKSCNLTLDYPPKKFVVQLGDIFVEVGIGRTQITPNLNVIFIIKDDYFDREGLYNDINGNYKDNAERFIFFSKAIVALLEEFEIKTDILHINDWQTGLVPAIIRTTENNNSFFKGVQTIFTVHHIAHQGLFWHYDLHMTNLPWDVFTPEGIEYYGRLNMLKSGIVYSDFITTLSPRYIYELQTESYGCGLEGLFQKRKGSMQGILGGIDYNEWSPENDRFIKTNYSLSSLAQKNRCKENLIQSCGLNTSISIPVYGLDMCYTDKNDLETLFTAFSMISDKKCILIILKDWQNENHEAFNILRNGSEKDMSVCILDRDQHMTHLLLAGSDFMLHPSRYQPCGLEQLHCLKYGTIPIVFASGPIDDIIADFDTNKNIGNGIKYFSHESEAHMQSIKKSLHIYKSPKSLRCLQENAMQYDLSWNRTAKEYSKLYLELPNKE